MRKNTLSLSLLYIGISSCLPSTASTDAIDSKTPWMPKNPVHGDYLNISGNGSICGNLNVHGTLITAMGNLANLVSNGNVLRVDAVFGNDATGTRNQQPFATINGALNAAQTGDVIILFPGTYNESFTIPAGITVAGLTLNGVHIAQTNVTTNTDLVTMGENSYLANVTLNLNANTDVQLRGIVFPGTTSATANVNQVRIQITNSANGTAPAYGIHSIGTGLPTSEFTALQNSTINVSSQGLRPARGILLDTNANEFNIINSGITVTNPAGGSAIGIETNIANVSCVVSTSTINGSTADISQTDPNSTITIANTQLVNSNANSRGFNSTSPSSILTWALPGTPGTATTGFLTPGTGMLVSSSNNLPFIVPQTGLIKNLNVQAVTPAGQGSTTFTIFRNGVATTLTTALNDTAITNVNNSISVPCVAGDQISLQVTNTVGATANISVTAELY